MPSVKFCFNYLIACPKQFNTGMFGFSRYCLYQSKYNKFKNNLKFRGE